MPSTPPTPDAENPLLARVLSLLEDQTEKIARLETELRETKARTASFVPMDANRPQRGLKSQLAGMKNGEQREGVSRQVLVDERGDKVPAMLLAQYPPRFEAGSHVQIDPGSTREGFPEGQTWGQVLTKIGSAGYGVVRKIYWLRDDGEWKYSVTVPGLTNGRPDGFHDRELLPA